MLVKFGYKVKQKVGQSIPLYLKLIFIAQNYK